MMLGRLAGSKVNDAPADDLVPPEMMRCALSMGVLTQPPLGVGPQDAKLEGITEVSVITKRTQS